MDLPSVYYAIVPSLWNLLTHVVSESSEEVPAIIVHIFKPF